mmetsp:Transcript_56613/g.131992  ORF Transcript_56613/g.131992 Transcript_56613/m.131992 type:complete len:287 (+) Transcript_56613:819-1679(+)
MKPAFVICAATALHQVVNGSAAGQTLPMESSSNPCIDNNFCTLLNCPSVTSSRLKHLSRSDRFFCSTLRSDCERPSAVPKSTSVASRTLATAPGGRCSALSSRRCCAVSARAHLLRTASYSSNSVCSLSSGATPGRAPLEVAEARRGGDDALGDLGLLGWAAQVRGEAALCAAGTTGDEAAKQLASSPCPASRAPTALRARVRSSAAETITASHSCLGSSADHREGSEWPGSAPWARRAGRAQYGGASKLLGSATALACSGRPTCCSLMPQASTRVGSEDDEGSGT